MRRLFIIRKDLHLSLGKLAAMVVHASFDIEREIYDDYLNGRITKTTCFYGQVVFKFQNS